MAEGIRINKYLSQAGVCSRREADRQLALGQVGINGRIAQLGDRVGAGDRVIYKGKPVVMEEEKILLMVNKPRGIVCTAEKKEKNNIIDYLQYPKRIYPVGRLDKDSQGLLLMTNEGDLVNKIMRAGNYHEKEYLVEVDRSVTDDFLRGMAGGVPILGQVTRKCKLVKTGSKSFRIILTQGLNRQIRRMCQYFGYQVRELKRVRIMNLELGDLEPGSYRSLTAAEEQGLMELLKDSVSEPFLYRKSNTLKS